MKKQITNHNKDFNKNSIKDGIKKLKQVSENIGLTAKDDTITKKRLPSSKENLLNISVDSSIDPKRSKSFDKSSSVSVSIDPKKTTK